MTGSWHRVRGMGPPARFALVGAICTAAQYLVLLLMVEAAHTRPLAASAISYALAVVLSYELNRRVTFGGPAARASFVRFVIVSCIGLALNTALFHAASRAGMPHYLGAQAVATLVTMFVNYGMHRHWSFRIAGVRAGEGRP